MSVTLSRVIPPPPPSVVAGGALTGDGGVVGVSVLESKSSKESEVLVDSDGLIFRPTKTNAKLSNPARKEGRAAKVAGTVEIVKGSYDDPALGLTKRVIHDDFKILTDSVVVGDHFDVCKHMVSGVPIPCASKSMFDVLNDRQSNIEKELWARETQPGIVSYDNDALTYIGRTFLKYGTGPGLIQAERDVARILEAKCADDNVLTESACQRTFISAHLRIQFLMFTIVGGCDTVREELDEEYGSVSDYMAKHGVTLTHDIPSIKSGFTSVHISTKLGRSRGVIPSGSFTTQHHPSRCFADGAGFIGISLSDCGPKLTDKLHEPYARFSGNPGVGLYDKISSLWRILGSMTFTLCQWANHPSHALVVFTPNIVPEISKAIGVELGSLVVRLYDPSSISRPGMIKGPTERGIVYPIHDPLPLRGDWEWPGIKVGKSIINRLQCSFTDTYRSIRPSAPINGAYTADEVKNMVGGEDVYVSGYGRDGTLITLVDDGAYSGTMPHTPLQHFAAGLSQKVSNGFFDFHGHAYDVNCSQCMEVDAVIHMMSCFVILSMGPYVCGQAEGSRIVVHDGYTVPSCSAPTVVYDSMASSFDIVNAWLTGRGKCPNYLKGFAIIRRRGLTKDFKLSGKPIPCMFDDGRSPFEDGLGRLLRDEGYVRSHIAKSGVGGEKIVSTLESMRTLPFLFVKGRIVHGDYTPLGLATMLASYAEIIHDGGGPHTYSLRYQIPLYYMEKGILACREAEDAGGLVLKYLICREQWRPKFVNLTPPPETDISRGTFMYDFTCINDADVEADPFGQLHNEVTEVLKKVPFLWRSLMVGLHLCPKHEMGMLRMSDIYVWLFSFYSFMLRCTSSIGYFTPLFSVTAEKFPRPSKWAMRHIPKPCRAILRLQREHLLRGVFMMPTDGDVCSLATSKSTGIDKFKATSTGPATVTRGKEVIRVGPVNITGRPKSVLFVAQGFKELVNPRTALLAMGNIPGRTTYRKDRLRPLRPVYAVTSGRLVAGLAEFKGRKAAILTKGVRQSNFINVESSANTVKKTSLGFKAGVALATDGSSFDMHEVTSALIYNEKDVHDTVMASIEGSDVAIILTEHYKDIATGACSFSSEYLGGDKIRLGIIGNLSGSMSTGLQNSGKNNAIVTLTSDLCNDFVSAPLDARMNGTWVPEEYGFLEVWRWDINEYYGMVRFSSEQSMVAVTLDLTNVNVNGDDMLAILVPSPLDRNGRMAFAQVVMKIALLAYLFAGHTIKPSAVSLSSYFREFLKMTVINMQINQRARNFHQENSAEGTFLDTQSSAYGDACAAQDREEAYKLRTTSSIFLMRTRILGDVRRTFYVPSVIDAIANGCYPWPFMFHIIPIAERLGDEWALGKATTYTVTREPQAELHADGWELSLTVSGNVSKPKPLHEACKTGRRDFLGPPPIHIGPRHLPPTFYAQYGYTHAVDNFVLSNITKTALAKHAEEYGVGSRDVETVVINRLPARSFMCDSVISYTGDSQYSVCSVKGVIMLCKGSEPIRSWAPFPQARAGPQTIQVLGHILGIAMNEPPSVMGELRSIRVGPVLYGPLQLAGIYLRYCMKGSSSWTTDAGLVSEALREFGVHEDENTSFTAEADRVVYHAFAYNEMSRFTQTITTSYVSRNVATFVCKDWPQTFGTYDAQFPYVTSALRCAIMHAAICYDIFKRYVCYKQLLPGGVDSFMSLHDYLTTDRCLGVFPEFQISAA